MTREQNQRVGLAADQQHVELCEAADDHQRGRRGDGRTRLADGRVIDHGQRQQGAEQDLHDPEQLGVDAAVHQDKALHAMMLGGVQVRQVVDDHEVEHRGDEHAQQVLETEQHGVAQRTVGPGVGGHQHQDEYGKAVGEGHDDEHRRQQGRVIGLAGDQEAENGTGTGGQDQAPDEGEKAGHGVVLVHLAFHHEPQVHRGDGDESVVEDDVPRKDRLEVVVGHGDDQAVGVTEIEHQNHQAADEQGDGEQRGQTPERLVQGLAEHGADGGHVERAGGGDDQEDGKDVRHAPDDLVVHAGNVVPLVLHIQNRAQGEPDERAQSAEQNPEAGTLAFSFAIVQHLFHG